MPVSNSDHFFSSDNTRSPQKSNFNFSAPSPFKHCLTFSSSNFDFDTSSLPSSQNSNCEKDYPSTSRELGSSTDISTLSSSSLVVNLRSTSMTLRSASVQSGACGSASSDSDCNSEFISVFSGTKRFKSSNSPRHMTLRNTPKRRSRRLSGNGSRTYIFK